MEENENGTSNDMQPDKNKKSGVKITSHQGDGSVLMKIDLESDFAKAIRNIFEAVRPKKLIETGTYLGTGTTSIIANTLKELKLTDSIFHTIEVNPVFYRKAVENLIENQLIDYVNMHNGLSVPRTLLPSVKIIEEESIFDLKEEEIFVDHDETERVKKYYNETDFPGVPDDLLLKCLEDFSFAPDFVLLDSAGHMGNIEFNYLIEKIKNVCYIALDDVNHLKHYKSLKQIKTDPRFELLMLSDEKFGFCVARFTPAKNDKEKTQLPQISCTIKERVKLPLHIVAIGLVEHLGDIIACEPVSRYARQKYPDSYITWCTKNSYKELIENNPFVDEIYTVSCLTEWIRLKESYIFDEVIDLHIQNRVCPVCDVPLLKDKGRIDITLENYYFHGNLLSVFCQSAGIPILFDAPQMYITENIVQEVDLLKLHQEYVVFHCLSNEVTRDWDDEKWIHLAEYVQKDMNITIVEVGHKSVLAKSPALKFTNLCNRVSMSETAEIIRRARLFVGIDSSCAHAANAVGTFGIILLGKYRAFDHYLPYSGEYENGNNAELIYGLDSAQSIPLIRVMQSVEKHLLNNDTAKKTMGFTPTQPQQKRNQLKHFVEEKDFRLISLYLPQFHPIEENDNWWGKGFTEWTNVAKAKPLFPGHYQPHIPSDLGFYDLRVPETRIEQAKLANEYGIEGFCYYHYWFNGKRLLEKPFDEVLNSGKPDFPFCLAWANENWTKRWDGRESEMLQEQIYGGEEDALNHFKYLLKTFTDKRYVTIDGKPVFMIYRPAAVTGLNELINLWQEQAAQAGLNGIFFIAMKTGFEQLDPGFWLKNGFDAEMIFQPGTGKINLKNNWKPLSASGADEHVSTEAIVVDYDEAWPIMAQEADNNKDCFTSVVPSWDNTARRAKIGAYILANASPESYKMWLKHELNRVLERDLDKRLVFLNAWNEWAEGNHLEPDFKNGRGYLEATLDAYTESLLDLARIALRQNLLNDAELYCKKAIAIYAKTTSASYHKKMYAKKLENPEYSEHETTEPYLSKAHYLLAQVYFLNNKISYTFEQFKIAFNYNKQDLITAISFADFCISINNPAVATAILGMHLTGEDKPLSVFFNLANLLVLLEQPKEAEYVFAYIAYKEKINDKGTSYYDFRKLFNSEFINNNFGTSLGALIKIVHSFYFFETAQKYLADSLVDGAIENLNSSIKEYPEFLPALISLSVIYGKMNNFENAFLFINQALKIKPDDYAAKKALAGLFIKHGDIQEAASLFKELLKLNPADVKLLLSVAELQKHFGEYKTALVLIENALKLKPGNTEALALKKEIEKLQNNATLA